MISARQVNKASRRVVKARMGRIIARAFRAGAMNEMAGANEDPAAWVAEAESLRRAAVEAATEYVFQLLKEKPCN